MGNPFEETKSPEDIAQLMKERQSSDKKLRAGGAEYKDWRLDITEEQFEVAKKEMEKDLQDKEKREPQSHEEKKGEVHEKISKLEESLGQPISEESRQMIHKNELEGFKKEETGEAPKVEEGYRLKREARELEGKQREKENSASILKEKLKSGDFTNSVKKLAIVLREREANGFNPLINPNAIPYLINAVNELDASAIDPKASIEDINRSIKKIGGAIRSIGDVPRQMRVNDHPDSLRKIGFTLQNIDQTSLALASRIGGLEDKNMGETVHYLRSLQSLVRDKWAAVAKKRNDLEKK